MARYIADQNKVVFLNESGTYGVTSGTGFWIGQVTEHSIDDNENKMEDTYLGTASRNFGDFLPGPRDVSGKLSFFPQDMRLFFLSVGSVFDTSGTNSVHTATEISNNVQQNPFTSGTLNPPVSFTLEDSKTTVGTGANFIRTIVGCVPNSVTLIASQGEKDKVDLDYIGKTLTFTSGTSTAVTENTTKPFLWNSNTLTIGGSTIPTAKEVSLSINQNLEAPHYVEASRDISIPYPTKRETTLSVTLDLNNPEAKRLYQTFYKDHESFNCVLDKNQDASTGSQHVTIVMSGCYIVSMENPSTSEGISESTIEIRPKTLSATSWDRTARYNFY